MRRRLAEFKSAPISAGEVEPHDIDKMPDIAEALGILLQPSDQLQKRHPFASVGALPPFAGLVMSDDEKALPPLRRL
jgi:hypothetical protein